MPRLSKIGAAALAAFGWTSGSSVTASYLVVAGGGGGGIYGGGGGAGGLLTGTTSLNPTLSYTVTVGAGGAGTGTQGVTGVSGSNSVFGSFTSTGGGGGGVQGTGTTGSVGLAGGSGGGGGSPDSGGVVTGAGGAGTSGQGNAGGSGITDNSAYRTGGGGGGASAAGANGVSANGGNGGNGTASSISGSSVTYAGGGGGGTNSTGRPAGTGGTGGGGAGGAGSANGSNGTANLGGGAGGAGALTGGSGGSGVVIISYPGAQQFGGGNVTTDGTNTIHTFTTSGTLSVLVPLTASALVVAGGGGGGRLRGGGGGAGGLRTSTTLTIDTSSVYLVTVGAGGAGSTVTTATGTNGSNSVFYSITSTGGGGGGTASGTTNTAVMNGATGGSGGGGATDAQTGTVAGLGGAGNTPSTSPSQGNNGGASSALTQYGGGGGGGASAVGETGKITGGAAGGAGTASSISGSSVTYAGGGGGGTSAVAGAGGAGGAGGGGAGGSGSAAGSSGTANTGGGGGGDGNPGTNGGTGGSGIVIISYAGATQLMAGGTVTISGGNVIHTFTSSGYLTPIKYASRSLRFRSSASAYLNRTPTVASNRQTWTWSGWVKRGKLGATQGVFARNDASVATYILFTSSDTLTATSASGAVEFEITTTQVFRDPSAWYHIVIVLDTTQATSSNRVKLYVNGAQITALGTATYPSQNYSAYVNTAATHYIGNGNPAGSLGWYSDQYMTEVNFIDGAALTPSSFGTFNSFGVWQPITYGGSYGTNGFYLPMNPGTSTYAGLVSSSNYLTAPSNAAFAVGTSDFTMETWFYPTSASQTGQFFFVSTGGIQMGYLNSSNWGLCHANVAWQTTTGTLPTTNAWNHMAITRSGTTIALFMNGVRLATGTIGTNYAQNTCVIGQGIIGYMSNSRFVKGTAVYNPSNPTYTVPTAPLTNITNTSLLTFQDSTNIDNSSNAFSLTATGTVIDSVAYPFNLGTIPDYSPQGNNWTANNIQPVAGVSMDVMTDVPTLTSATVANYWTFNPLISVSGATYSNGNLQYTNSNNNRSGFASPLPTTGKWYWEATWVTNGGGSSPIVGLAQAGFENTQGATGELGYRSNGNKFDQNGTESAYGASWTTGDVIGVAVDMGAGTIAFYKNGTSQGTAFTTVLTALTQPVSPMFRVNVAGDVLTLNFGQQGFTYTPPSGFVALNTYNLTTPTIPNGATQMNATIYTGTGSNPRTFTGLGFQPDWIWNKSRSNAGFGALWDSVRGGTKALQTYSTGSEADFGTAGGSITSFNSDGATFANGSINDSWFNSSSVTYVSWQWKANGTGVSNTDGTITSTVSANTTAGFSVVIWTGGGSAGTIGHGLGVTPGMIIVKNRSGTQFWFVNHASISTTQNLYLNDTAAVQSDGIFTSRGATTFGVGTGVAGSATNYVAYVFAAVAGYSAFGSYTGNGSADGPFLYTGFRPRWVLIKQSNDVNSWFVWDSTRNSYNAANLTLKPNSSDAEETIYLIDALSNGFKIRTSDVRQNTSGGTYIYMAFAENPFKYANAR